jgi:hypothetical protein
MNLREEILKEHSKRQTRKIVDYIGDDGQRFGKLMALFLNDEYRVVQRSAWMVSECGINFPRLVKPYLKQMTSYLVKPGTHPAVKRNILRIFQFTDLPKGLQGKVADLCFGFLLSKDEAIAVKAFSMTVLSNIAKQNPDLKNEIKLVVEDMLPYGSAGLRSRGKRTLKELEKI